MLPGTEQAPQAPSPSYPHGTGGRGRPGAGCDLPVVTAGARSRAGACTPSLAPALPCLTPPPLCSPANSVPGPGLARIAPSSPHLCLSPGSGLRLRSKKKPEETNQGNRPPPSLRPPAPNSARNQKLMVARPHLPPRKMKSLTAKMLPLLPNHSLPIKTLILFNFAMGRVGRVGPGCSGTRTPLPAGLGSAHPGCVEVVQSHCRALYVLDYCYILYIFLFFFVYICGIFRDSYTS